jgi:hypothetical protein
MPMPMYWVGKRREQGTGSHRLAHGRNTAQGAGGNGRVDRNELAVNTVRIRTLQIVHTNRKQ